MQLAVVIYSGIEVQLGDIVVGDNDRVLVGNLVTFLKFLPISKKIQHIESRWMNRMNISLSSLSDKSSSWALMMHLDEHVQRRLEDKPLDIEFLT